MQSFNCNDAEETTLINLNQHVLGQGVGQGVGQGMGHLWHVGPPNEQNLLDF